MTNISEDIKAGLERLNRKTGFKLNSQYGAIYFNTNEGLSKYYRAFPCKGGRVLTVSSGGDHILQAVCDGAKEIDAFDRNRFAIYAAKLKITALKVLGREEFKNYYYNLKGFLNVNTYMRIRTHLEEDVKEFWDAMYFDGKLLDNVGSFVACSYTSFTKCFDDSFRRFSSPYFYARTKKNLKISEINFFYSGLYELVDFLDKNKKYDAIFLSNIYDWLILDERENFSDLIENLSKHLTDNGMMAVYAPFDNPNPKICSVNESCGEDGFVYTLRKGERLEKEFKRL
ncbi:MAG: DUF3419 family protein [Bacilli bacterium]|nr:DUF3419 family protein [Bacilli bacterium]